MVTSSGSIYVASVTAIIELGTCLVLLQLMTHQRVGPDLARTRDLVQFIVSVMLVTGLAGCAVAIAEWFHGAHALAAATRDGAYWWAGDAISIIVFTPLVTTWRTWQFLKTSRSRLVFALSILLLALGMAIALGGEDSKSVMFLLLPIVIFNALLAGVAGAASSGALLTMTLVEFSMSGATTLDLIIRLIFVATATITGYFLGIVWTEREETGQQLEHLARHDMLTGIFKRYEFENRLRDTLARKGEHALLYLDLDQFKLVNDTCGHMAGDRMLQELARDLQRVLPRTATFARLGGDELACLLLQANEEDARTIAAALHDVTARYRFHFGSMSFTVGVSIGITFFPGEEGDSADAVLGRADVACYVAKEDGRNRSHVYFPRDEVMLKWHSSIQEVAQLENAMS